MLFFDHDTGGPLPAQSQERPSSDVLAQNPGESAHERPAEAELGLSGAWFGQLTPHQRDAVGVQLASGARPSLVHEAVRRLGWLEGEGLLRRRTAGPADAMPLVGPQPSLKFRRDDGVSLRLDHHWDDGTWSADCPDDPTYDELGFVTLQTAMLVLADGGFELAGCRG